MKRFKIEQSDANIVSHGGLALIGQALQRHTSLACEIDARVALRHDIKHSDVIKSYLAMLCQGKNDFEAINTIESEFYFMSAMDISDITSEATLRQRMDNHAKASLPIVEKASLDFLARIQPSLRPLHTGHIPLDAEVTPMDNGGTRKEGVSRTYKRCGGYAPMAVYLGQEGYYLAFDLREGKQHCQKETPALLDSALRHARGITDQPLLIRLDVGNDFIESIDVVLEHNQTFSGQAPVDFLIKWNPHRESKEDWLSYAERHGRWDTPREGKRVAVFSVEYGRQWKGYE